MATPNASFEALRGEGFTGSLSDMRRQNLLALLSLTEPQGTNNDLELRYWRAQGKTGSILDARHQNSSRTNLATNSNYESGVNCYNSNNAASYPVTADTVSPILGARSAVTIRTGTLNTAVSSINCTPGDSTTKFPVVAGQPVTGALSTKTDVANAVIYTRWYWYDAGLVQTQGAATIRQASAAVGQVYRVVETGTPPANMVSAQFVVSVFTSGANCVGGEKVWYDQLVVETGITDGSWF